MKTLEELLQYIEKNGGRIDGTVCNFSGDFSGGCCNCSIEKFKKTLSKSYICAFNKELPEIIKRTLRKRKLEKLLS